MAVRSGLSRRLGLAALCLIAAVPDEAAAQRDPAEQMLDRDPEVQRSFAADLRQGLIDARVAPEDANTVLYQLIAARHVAPVPPARGHREQSLAEISNQRFALTALFAALRSEYRIVELRSNETIYVDDSMPGFPPAMSAWLSLRLLTMAENYPAADHRIAGVRTEPALRWKTPAPDRGHWQRSL